MIFLPFFTEKLAFDHGSFTHIPTYIEWFNELFDVLHILKNRQHTLHGNLFIIEYDFYSISKNLVQFLFELKTKKDFITCRFIWHDKMSRLVRV